MWHCCGPKAGSDTDIDCNNPTNESWAGNATNPMWLFYVLANAVVPTGSTSAASISTGSGTASSTSASTSRATSTRSSLPQNGGLTSGAKIGIGVGAAIAGLLLVVAMAWIIVVTRRLRRLDRRLTGESKSSPTGQQMALDYQQAKPELHHDSRIAEYYSS